MRRAKFLNVAANLMGELGYEALTMKAVAEQAGASIGTLYDYFPDKQTLATALLAQYTEEADAHWSEVLSKDNLPTKSAFPGVFVKAILDFSSKRPGYLALLGAPLAYSRTASARKPLRKTIASALQMMNGKLAANSALIRANVIVELIKGLLAINKQSASKEKDLVIDEFKRLIRLYLNDALADK